MNSRVESCAKVDSDEHRIQYRRIQEIDRRYRDNIRQTSKLVKESDGKVREEQVW